MWVDFWWDEGLIFGMKLGKCLILVGFDDMGYDKGFGGGDLGFCLILVGIFDIGKVKF